MQKLTTIREIFRNRDAYIGQTVEIGGWVRNIRDSKTFGFLVVNDGTYFENNDDEIDIVSKINSYIDDGMDTMSAIKRVSKERKMKKSDVYSMYHKESK